MIQNQISILNTNAVELLQLASETSKTKDKLLLITAGRELLADAKALLQENNGQAILFYLEWALLTGEKPSYSNFLDFCVRNSRETVSIADYQAVLDGLQS